jgi:Kdo2-lipid IVA lauroyltransferase/acyltransferase
MSYITGAAYYLLIYPVSILPFPALYAVSDLIFILLFHVLRYRRKVVYSNLTNSFPEKSKREIDQIARNFYRHFCDLIMESLKLFTISEKEVRQRITFDDLDLLHRFYEEKKSVILAGGHYNNWEFFAVAVQLYLKHQVVALYKPLANPWFDKKMRETRGRYGMQMIPIQQVKTVFQQDQEIPTASIFGMDQSPSKGRNSHWMRFMNQETAVSFGTEKYARESGQPVVFGRILKLRRGYYKVRFELLSDEHQSFSHGGIVEKAMHMLEEDIRKEPEWWLWTHRRWKHRRLEDGKVILKSPVR